MGCAVLSRFCSGSFETCCDLREIGLSPSGKSPVSEAYALIRLNKVGKSEFRSVHVLFLFDILLECTSIDSMKSIICVAHPKIEAQSFRGDTKYGKPETNNLGPWLWIPGPPRPISGLPEIGTIRCAHRQQAMCGGEPE
jgi:hypothetical protein